MPDVAINAQAVINAGQGYTVPDFQEIIVRAVRASYNGAAAAGSYVPTLQIVTDGGLVVAECPVSSTVAAGASADVSWFPRVTAPATTTTSSGDINAIAEGLGLVAWTVDPNICEINFRPSTRTLIAPVWLAAGTVVTYLSTINPAVEAVPPTHAYHALYTPAFARAAITADLPSPLVASWNTWALTAPYTVPADGLYYVGALYDPASQTPTMLASQANNGTMPALPTSGKYRTPQVVAVATFPNPFVPTSSAIYIPCMVLS